jgi:mandelate racemase
VRTVRKVIGDGVALMVDYNQALTVAEALLRGRALDAEGIYWLEEPIRHDDYRGYARLAAELATPVQIGENFSQPFAMQQALDAGACDYVMPDLERIGGVTGWQRAAAIAAAHGVEMSSHLFPEVSAHLMAVTPTAHWLEYVDWAAPILEQPIAIEDGFAVIPDRPGNGLAWKSEAVERFRVP